MTGPIESSGAVHNPACESAAGDGCECRRCFGVLHRSTVLRVAIARRNLDKEPPDTADWTAEKFDEQLTKPEYFGLGSAFTSEKDKPGSGEEVRSCRRGWDPDAKDPGRMSTQVQCRIVDVALRELLRNVFVLPHHAKPRWGQVAGIFTLKNSWQDLETALTALPMPERKDPDVDRDGYFWSAMLAALSKAATEDDPDLIHRVFLDSPADSVARVQNAIIAAVNADSEFFAAWCRPSVSTQKNISYIKLPEELTADVRAEAVTETAIKTAAEILGEAVMQAGQLVVESASDSEKRDRAADCLLLIQMVGAVSSLDLWHHPAAVRYLLLPAIGGVRARHSRLDEPEPDAGFSFDTQGPQATEKLIYSELVASWRLKKHWGNTRDSAADQAMDGKIAADKERARGQAQNRRSTAKTIADLQARVEGLERQIKAVTARLDGLAGQGVRD